MKSDLPQYYREGFFSKDSMFHPELQGGRYGVAGDPVPYSVRNDNIITSLLLACFIFAVIAFANARRFIIRQAKDIIYLPYPEQVAATITAIDTFLGVILGISSANYYKEQEAQEAPDGKL